jgi:hypothetical protein
MSNAIIVERSGATAPSHANLPDIPAPLLALMAEIGPKWREDTAAHVDMMVTAFSEVLKLASRDGITVHRDITYGEHERQQLDLFLPAADVTATGDRELHRKSALGADHADALRSAGPTVNK